MLRLNLIFLIIALSHFANAQDEENLESIIEEFCSLKSHEGIPIEERKELIFQFEEKVKKLTLDESIYETKIHINDNCIKSVYSTDTLIRLFVWNNSITHHNNNFTNIIQYKTSPTSPVEISRIKTSPIPILEIGTFQENGERYYLFKGVGIVNKRRLTTLHVYQHKNGKFQEVHKTYPIGKAIEIWSSLKKNVHFKLNEKNNTVSYLKYEYDEKNRSFSKKNKRISLKFRDGVFTTPRNNIAVF